ncbi:VTC domain-containing protein [Candidatus Izemoplasma sp. B36]|uniref:VTC domain-containing protein n=1 Tax=Candidatus Izemoplasma sp. B36 TaxID=3242468 RepID=UPI00355856F7
MENNTFNRVEKKYIINETQYKAIKAYIETNLNDISDSLSFHETYNISNIYYDTDDNLIIKKSVSKPAFKQKLRLRAYGSIQKDSLIFIELKKKINGYVNKRRTQINLNEVDSLIIEHRLPELSGYHNEQVLKEILFFAKQYELKPSLYLYYEREVYSTKDKSNLRITFDKNITTRRFKVDLTKGNFGKNLLADDTYVLEIKTNKNMPYWLNQLLGENKVFSTSFSKYGSEFYEYLNKKYRKENKKCLNPYLEPLK